MPPLGRQLGIAEADRDAVLARAVEQRLGCRVRHLALEPAVHLGLVLHVPARKEGGERKLGIDDQGAALRLRRIQQGEHPLHHLLPGVGLLDRAHLGGTQDDFAHRVPFHSASCLW